jgi:MarR family transcriptional regulator, organic hydroperoxide resistance regulator
LSLRSSYSDAGDSPGFVLWKTSNLLQRRHAKALKKLGLTPAQFSVLANIVDLGTRHAVEEVTSALLVRRTGLDKMFVSDMIKTLAAKALIRVSPSPKDGRAKILACSKAGIDRANQAIRVVEKEDAEFFGALAAPEAFLRELRRLLGT